MKLVVALLGLVLLLDTILAAEESCVERCGSFNPRRKCQCDSMCVYYGSCCDDFDTICPKKNVRGDTFGETEEVTETVNTPTSETTTTFTPTFNTVVATTPASPPTPTTARPATIVDPDAAPCSARPFDAFLQLKNGSIYAFRGEYFFEFDDKSILPGYPKLIQDVWGLSGPIDAAFTRINCQGKSYLFKGNQYWRFDGDVLDEDYPRNISVGFDGIPEGIDAAFTVPAPNHRGKEKAYFFKGDKYYQYNFKQQPSHEECFHMSRSSPSLLFTKYTDLFCDQTWENWFTELFGSSVTSRLPGPRPRLTSTDWHGIRVPVDAAMLGRVRLSPKPRSPPPMRKRNNRRRMSSKKRSQRRKPDPYMSFYDVLGFDDMFEFLDIGDSIEEEPTWDHKGENGNPVQNVYFFRRDKYYRVNLQTKRVASARPPYPRSIAKYWLGCKDEEAADTSSSEKR